MVTVHTLSRHLLLLASLFAGGKKEDSISESIQALDDELSRMKVEKNALLQQ